MTAWPGTLLSAVFLAPSLFWTALPTLLAKWAGTGLLVRGTARWLALHPTQVSYDAVMTGASDLETVWTDDITPLVKQADTAALVQLTFPFKWEHGQGELTMDVVVNADDSVGVYLNAPYSEIYEEQSREIGLANIDRFVMVSCSLFDPSVFSLGYIGEEARFGGLANETHWPDDWAFYGSRLFPSLSPVLASLRTQAQDIRQLDGGGIFVRWTSWEEPPNSPNEWLAAVQQVRSTLLRTWS